MIPCSDSRADGRIGRASTQAERRRGWVLGTKRVEVYHARMALNIKNADVEKLATEVAALTGETKTEAIRRALEERRARLAFRLAGRDRPRRLRRFVENEVWPLVPEDQRGRRLSREEEEAILVLGPEGA